MIVREVRGAMTQLEPLTAELFDAAHPGMSFTEFQNLLAEYGLSMEYIMHDSTRHFLSTLYADCQHGRYLELYLNSNHADDHGVWIICREYRASSQEYAAGLISRCEKRLRREIHSNRYPIVNKDTAAHQLFGFKEALKLLGLIPENQWTVDPEYFYDKHSTPVDPQ